jgi:hypothetical protein
LKEQGFHPAPSPPSIDTPSPPDLERRQKRRLPDEAPHTWPNSPTSRTPNVTPTPDAEPATLSPVWNAARSNLVKRGLAESARNASAPYKKVSFPAPQDPERTAGTGASK